MDKVGTLLPIGLDIFTRCSTDRMIITVVSALCAVQAISVIAMQVVEWKYAKDQLQKAPALASSSPVCLIPLPDFFYALAIPYIGFDFVLFALAAVRALACYRELSPAQRSSSSFIAVFLRDSLLAFVVTFVLNLAIILVWQYAPHDLYAIVIYWASTIPAILANRMLINMRKVGRADQKTHSDMHSIATIRFRMSRHEGGQWVD
ncbi:hypothetical protein BD779DRAFT_1671959 [Infundibulicybe gibba]|nr:hypothetical protein BD779DRAFT_1671959 [Infundibulicybe gibba]